MDVPSSLRRLRQAVGVESLANATAELLAKSNAVEAAGDVSVCDVGGRVAGLFGNNRLLFEQRDKQFVSVLSILQGQDVSGIDLVKNRNFGVEVSIVRQGVVLNIVDGVGSIQSVRPNGADHLHRVFSGAIGELD